VSGAGGISRARPVSRLRYTQLGVWARLLTRTTPREGSREPVVVRRTETRHCTDALGLSLASRRLESRPTAAARLVIEASAPSRGLCGGASDEEKRLVDVPVGGSVV
jgi:hypothetical protein